MNRRRFLAALGGGVSLGGLWYARRPPRRHVDVRFHLTTGAARQAGVRPRVREYVETALAPVYDEVTVVHEGTVSVGTQDAYRVMRSGEWPTMVIGRYVDPGADGAIGDVNLLVTDGPVGEAPSGAGTAHLAAVGGARYLPGAPERDSFDDVLPYSRRARVAQVLVHEVGHALGLSHDHGTIRATADGTVASPMVSAYAWADDPSSRSAFDEDRSACGDRYPPTSGGERYLSFAFSDCARATLREYSGGVFLR